MWPSRREPPCTAAVVTRGWCARSARARFGGTLTVAKVKAHIDNDIDRAKYPRHHVLGNEAADRLAKAAIG